MEKFRKGLTLQVVIKCILAGGFVLAVLLLPQRTGHMGDIAAGFQWGALVGALGSLGVYIVYTIMSLTSQDALKKRYIAETDERKLYILQKSGSVGLDMCTYGLVMGAVIAGKYNEVVFLTLLVACLFVLIVRGALYVFYANRY